MKAAFAIMFFFSVFWSGAAFAEQSKIEIVEDEKTAIIDCDPVVQEFKKMSCGNEIDLRNEKQKKIAYAISKLEKGSIVKNVEVIEVKQDKKLLGYLIRVRYTRPK